MALTACRECGTPMPAHSHACPKCGATVASAPVAAYRPPPPRPAEKPEGSVWRTAAGWVFLLAVLAVGGNFFYRLSTEADQQAAAEEEMEREHELVRTTLAWVQDTLPTTPAPESGPVPTSPLAKRMWVIRRMLVDRAVWEREIRARHGASSFSPPPAWNSAHYQANARSYPAVRKYVEGRAAAAAEIQKASPTWMDERTAALAKESGMPAPQIATIFPRDHGDVPVQDARLADAMMNVHRHLVNMDPRVRPGGGDQLLFEREEDAIRFNDLVIAMHVAAQSANEARERRMTHVLAALPGVTRVIRR